MLRRTVVVTSRSVSTVSGPSTSWAKAGAPIIAALPTRKARRFHAVRISEVIFGSPVEPDHYSVIYGAKVAVAIQTAVRLRGSADVGLKCNASRAKAKDATIRVVWDYGASVHHLSVGFVGPVGQCGTSPAAAATRSRWQAAASCLPDSRWSRA